MGGETAIYSSLFYSMYSSLTISGPTTVDKVLATRVISGVVLDPDGQPVSGANVGAGMWNACLGVPDGGACSSGTNMMIANTTTDGSSQFRLTVVQGSGTLNITPSVTSGLSAYAFTTQAFDNKQIGISIQFLTQTKQDTVPAGGTLTTDPGTGPTPADPVTTAVTSPNAGDVSITEGPITQAAPPGYRFLTQQIDIHVTAAPATTAHPLVLTFTLDASRVPEEIGASEIQMARNGIVMPACLVGAGQANPDPCMSNRQTTADGDVRITVLTSQASSWNFAVPSAASGTGGAGGSTGGGSGGMSGSGGTGGTTSPKCPGTPTCSGHGTCTAGTCTCAAGYMGTSCSIDCGSNSICPDGNACKNNNQCGSHTCKNVCQPPSCSPHCHQGEPCGANADCGSQSCSNAHCQAPTCAPMCPQEAMCGDNNDCASRVCANDTCQPPACSPHCHQGETCGANADCGSQVCTKARCLAPTCSPLCSQGATCDGNGDCASRVCTKNICKPPVCSPNCHAKETCGSNADCGSRVCKAGLCQVPICSPTCAKTATCDSNGDCKSHKCTNHACQ